MLEPILTSPKSPSISLRNLITLLKILTYAQNLDSPLFTFLGSNYLGITDLSAST